jgi:peptide/nickel transport system substrate-binding protein
MVTRRRFIRGTLAASIALAGEQSAPPAAIAAPAADPTKPAGAKKGGTFTLAKTGAQSEFNPFQLNPGHFAYIRALYNTLVHYDSALTPQPELAESWNLTADGKALTLKLRQGVKFHSGREFTADDVKYSLGFGQRDESATMRPLFKSVTALDMPDNYTVTFRFAVPNASAFDLLDTLFIVDKENFADRRKSASGTGPFKLDKYIPNDHIEFSAFKDYWDKGKPYLDKYVIRDIPDQFALTVNLEFGAVDCVWQPNYLDLVRLKSSGGKFVADPGFKGANMFDVGINVSVPPLDKKKVRQAIAWSIDRARFCKTMLQGLTDPTCLIWPPHSWAYFKDLEGKIGYNLDKAKTLLKEAGVEGGFETEIMTTSQNFGFLELAQILQADLKKIGINAKIANMEMAQFQNRLQTKRDIQITIHSYGRTNRDPASTLTGAKAWYNDKEGNWTHYVSDVWDKLRADFQGTVDQKKREALARQIQEMALDECFTIPVALNQRAWAYGSYLKGFDHDLDYCPYVDGVWLDK